MKIPIRFALEFEAGVTIDDASPMAERFRRASRELQAFAGSGRLHGDDSLMQDLADALENLANVAKRMRAHTRCNPKEDPDHE